MNRLPHTLHCLRGFLATSLSALAMHCLQYERIPLPSSSKLRPHTLQDSVRVLAALPGACRRPRLGGPPASPALRLAAYALVRAAAMMRFSGSAHRLRIYSRARRRLASARHPSEQ